MAQLPTTSTKPITILSPFSQLPLANRLFVITEPGLTELNLDELLTDSDLDWALSELGIENFEYREVTSEDIIIRPSGPWSGIGRGHPAHPEH